VRVFGAEEDLADGERGEFEVLEHGNFVDDFLKVVGDEVEARVVDLLEGEVAEADDFGVPIFD